MTANFAVADQQVLKASKDLFARSNSRNRNSGGSETLLVAHASNIRSLIAFDLSGVTNQIAEATFRFQQQNNMRDAIDLTVAPLVQTEHNSAWREGSGALGTKGQNARPGDACYGWSAFPNVPWETMSGDAVTALSDSRLWGAPVASLDNLEWKENNWVEIKISNISLLEKIRESEHQTVTFGLWGTSGNGLYAISSKESGNAPELILTLKGKR